MINQSNTMFSCLGNIIWLIFGGFFIALEYLVASLFLFITVIGIPFGLQTLKMTRVAIFPFGTQITGGVSANGCISTAMNVIWILCGGIWICLTHLFFGLLFCITVIGIPFGKQHFKLASLALAPFGKSIS